MTEKRWKNSPHGFTLVEILVALLISSLLATAIYSFFIGQHHAYTVQDQVIEMEQNARAAMDLIRRELRMAGYHAMGGELLENLSTVVPADFVPDSPLPVNLGTKPIKITKGSGTESDMLTFLSVVSTNTNPTKIVENADAGDNRVTLDLTFSETKNQYRIEDKVGNKWDLFHLGFSSDYAKITDITYKTVIIDGESKTKGVLHFEVIPKKNSGGSTGLSKSYAAGSPIGEIYVVSYAVIEGSDGIPVLKRKVNAGYFQPVAENITDMQLQHLGSGEIEVILTSRTDRPDHKFQSNNGYRTYTAATRIKARNANAGDVEIGTNCPLPSAPASVSLDGLDDTDPCKINITWDTVTVSEEDCEVTGYKVFYGTNSGYYTDSVDVGNVTEYSLDVSAMKACTYNVAVSAVNNAGTGPKSDEKSITDSQKPETPKGLTAENINGVERKVALSWDKNSECDLQGYYIYGRSQALKDKLTLSPKINNDNIISKEFVNFTDTEFGTPINCDTYYYSIEAVDYCPNASDKTAEESVSPTAPAPPTDLQFSATDKLSWTLSTDDFEYETSGLNYIKGYQVYGRDESMNWMELEFLDSGTSEWTITDNTISEFGVSAKDECENESEIVTILSICILRPTVTVSVTPISQDGKVSYTVTVNVTAEAPADRDIISVELNIGSVELNIDDLSGGYPSWSYSWDTTFLEDGEHTITVRAEDSEGCSKTESVKVTIDNSGSVDTQLSCDLYACKSSNKIYVVVHVFDQNDQNVSNASVTMDIEFQSGSQLVEISGMPGYYGGTLNTSCGLYTDSGEQIKGTGITNESKNALPQKNDVKATVVKDELSTDCTRNFQ